MNAMYTDTDLKTISDLVTHLQSPLGIEIKLGISGKQRADWIFERLVRFKYLTLSKKEKGIVLKYINSVVCIGEKQLSRHISSYKKGKRLCRQYKRNGFISKYSLTDTELLAEIDNATGRLSGALAIALIKDEYERGDTRFRNLSSISISQLYRIRKTKRYFSETLSVGKTHPTTIPIGERTKPRPNGIPGYIRVDTVHQGDLDQVKGVYHINLVDEVTQWEIVFAVSKISEETLLPLLAEALEKFPFEIINFHSDNGSEFINYRVAELLEKLRISQTKSRPRRSNDNGLVETKNGAIIRKELGHWHIPQMFDCRINRFYNHHLIPYLNFYRPCHFPKTDILENGRKKITYPKEKCCTPYKKLQTILDRETYLKPGVTKQSLDTILYRKTPLQAAKEKKKARNQLLQVVIPKLSHTISSYKT